MSTSNLLAFLALLLNIIALVLSEKRARKLDRMRNK